MVNLPGLGRLRSAVFLTIVRWFVLAGVLVRFWLHRDEYPYSDQRIVVLAIFLGILALYTVLSSVVLQHRWFLDRQPSWSIFQILCDVTIFSVLYLLTGTAESDFFLFYFLPIYVAAENLNSRLTLVSFGLVSAAFLVVIGILAMTSQSVVAVGQLAFPVDDILRIFTPRVTFYLAILYLAFGQGTRINQRNAELEALREIDCAMAGNLDSQKLLQIVVTQCQQFFGASSCHIRLVDGQLLRMVAGSGPYYETAPTIIYINGMPKSGSIYAYTDRKPYVVQEATNDDYLAEFRLNVHDQALRKALYKIRSVGCFPLEWGGEVIGVLCLQFNRPNALTEAVCRRIADFARRGAIAIHNAGIVSQLSHRWTESERLLRVTSEITQLPNERKTLDILEPVVRAAIEAIPPAICGSAFVLDRSDGTLRLLASQGYPDREAPPAMLSLGEGIAGCVAQYEQPILANDVQNDPHLKDSRIAEFGKSIESCICVPIISHKELVGVLRVDSLHHASTFSDADLRTLVGYAGQAAIAIHNVDLYTTATRNVDTLSALNTIGNAVSAIGSMRIDAFAKLVYEQLRDRVLVDVSSSYYLATYSLVKDQVDFVYVVENGIEVVPGIGQYESRISGNGLTEYVIRESVPVLIAARVAETTVQYGIECIGTPALSWLGVPIIVKGKVIAVIVVQHYEKENVYDETHRMILSTIAAQTAMVMDNYNTFYELQRTRDHLQAVLTSSPDAIVAMDRQYHITAFNSGSEALLGYASTEVLDQLAARLFWNGSSEIEKVMRRLINESGHLDEEIFMRHKNGDRIPVLLSASILCGTSPEFVGAVSVIRDLRLSALRGRTRALFDALAAIESQVQLDAILEAVALEAVNLLEADAGCLFLKENGVYVARPESAYGCDEARVKRSILTENTTIISDMLRSNKPVVVDCVERAGEIPSLTSQASSQLIAPICITQSPLAVLVLESQQADFFVPQDSELYGVIDILRRQAAIAISRAQLAEAQAKTSQAMIRTANVVVAGQIAAGIGHELKNGLNNLALKLDKISYSVHREVAVATKDKFAKQFESIEEEILRMAQLAERLHKFSQRDNPEPAEVYINSIVRSAVDALSGTLKDSRITCELSLDPALDQPPKGRDGTPVRVDHRQIRQVIMNLVLNAIDVSSPRSKIIICTELQPEQAVTLSVTDFGRGIEPGEKKQLFQPFYTTKHEGTGLGLYICRQIIVDNHKGTIDIDTKPGKGTTFNITLPVE
jgi:PAS domain S-box-containing protein